MKNLKLIFSVYLTFFLLEFSYAQDWANLKRFQKGNAELAIPRPGDHRVVFMGNSITEGWLRIRPEFFANRSYVNRGISGQTTPQMLLRFRQDVINLRPSVVVILAGINDIAGNTGPSTIEAIAGNIFSMAELAKAHNIRVVLCSVLPASHFPWRPKLKPAKKVVKLNALLKSYAEKHNMVYVDYFTAMIAGPGSVKGLKKDFSDGVHPNATGYSVMEPLVENAIAKALIQK